MNTAPHFGYLRIAAITPELQVADLDFNVSTHLACLESAHKQGAHLVLFPELSLTGYSCADLFMQDVLLSRTRDALLTLAGATRTHAVHALVGLPLVIDDRLFNAAALIGDGRILGIVPKTYLPTTKEFYEQRWFTSASQLQSDTVRLGDSDIPVSPRVLFTDSPFGLTLGVEICEDLWAVNPPSGELCLAGANVILNPSASNELLGKAPYRRDLVKQQSARCLAAYAYVSAGPGESSTDIVYSGHGLIAENGALLAESERFQFGTQMTCADIDLQRLTHERLANGSFSAARAALPCLRIAIRISPKKTAPRPTLGSLRPNPTHPFVPKDPAIRATTCREIFAIQSTGLAKRLRHTGSRRVVIGISGGLDSTLALLVAVHAFDLLGLDRSGIIAPTMPGFGTTKRTRGNAEKLVEALGATLRVIPIGPSVKQHFADIGHDPAQLDVTYENAQARERTQILMDVANQVGGFVVGTGDLSEAALGWCTFNGDHMSMYHVNIGVPKTLVRYLIDWCAEAEFSGATTEILHDIAATPISPELLPMGANDEILQQTEDVVGPYELHDFFLFHIVRHGSRPAKVLHLAELAFGQRYRRAVVLKWLEVFVKRFFSQQFKRSAMPDGPKVGSVALSPRGDWRMPSDASSATWLADIAALAPTKKPSRSRGASLRSS